MVKYGIKNVVGFLTRMVLTKVVHFKQTVSAANAIEELKHY